MQASFEPAAIFGRIVQQRGDRFDFGPTGYSYKAALEIPRQFIGDNVQRNRLVDGLARVTIDVG